VSLGFLAAAWFMWWLTPRLSPWSTPGQPPWMIWFAKAVSAGVFALSAVYVIIGAFN
jgi:hypothetical protein